MLDVSNNPIDHLTGLENVSKLEELWASNCNIADFAEVERELKDKEQLNTVYFEGNPLQRNQPVLYRNKVRLALPQVRQIDASEFFIVDEGTLMVLINACSVRESQSSAAGEMMVLDVSIKASISAIYWRYFRSTHIKSISRSALAGWSRDTTVIPGWCWKACGNRQRSQVESLT